MDKTNNLLSVLNDDLYEIEVEFLPGKKSITVLDLRGVKISYNALKEEISLNEIKTQLKPEDGQINLKIFIDRTSIEIYANGGKVYMPLINIMPQENLNYSILVAQGESKVKSLKVHELSSIWFVKESI